jgi:hypothetical protein
VFDRPFKLERLDFGLESVNEAHMRPARALAVGVLGPAAEFAIVFAEALDGVRRNTRVCTAFVLDDVKRPGVFFGFFGWRWRCFDGWRCFYN